MEAPGEAILRSQIENLVVEGKGLRVTKSDPGQFLPTSFQKSYFMLSHATRAVLDTALQKYRPGRTDLVPIGGIAQLKPALQLMTEYRLVIQDINGAEVLTTYTRWLECVQVKEGPEQEVYVAYGAKTISLEELRRVFGLESVKDAEGNIIKKAPLPV
jgi:hypothetical protein